MVDVVECLCLVGGVIGLFLVFIEFVMMVLSDKVVNIFDKKFFFDEEVMWFIIEKISDMENFVIGKRECWKKMKLVNRLFVVFSENFDYIKRYEV